MGTKSNPYHVQSANRLLPKIEIIYQKNNNESRIKLWFFKSGRCSRPISARKRTHSDLHIARTLKSQNNKNTNKRRSPANSLRTQIIKYGNKYICITATWKWKKSKKKNSLFIRILSHFLVVISYLTLVSGSIHNSCFFSVEFFPFGFNV